MLFKIFLLLLELANWHFSSGDSQVPKLNHERLEQGGKTWQPFVGGKKAMKIFVERVFTIFATYVLLLRVIANLQI